uniref:Uncharacterized protein n=1 Tax=Arundo donax TaxID=35708 RepID=A0A0A8XVH5_ARUDO
MSLESSGVLSSRYFVISMSRNFSYSPNSLSSWVSRADWCIKSKPLVSCIYMFILGVCRNKCSYLLTLFTIMNRNVVLSMSNVLLNF